MSRMAAPQMRVRMWSWPMVMRSRKVLMTHVMRHQEVAEPREVPAHSAAMTDGVAVSTFRKVNSPVEGSFDVAYGTHGSGGYTVRVADLTSADQEPDAGDADYQASGQQNPALVSLDEAADEGEGKKGQG